MVAMRAPALHCAGAPVGCARLQGEAGSGFAMPILPLLKTVTHCGSTSDVGICGISSSKFNLFDFLWSRGARDGSEHPWDACKMDPRFTVSRTVPNLLPVPEDKRGPSTRVSAGSFSYLKATHLEVEMLFHAFAGVQR